MDAVSITEHLQNMLQIFDLTPENCVGQGFDGASAMAGKNGGVQALLKKLGQKFLLHCTSFESCSGNRSKS